tara:strand:- start:75 stop:881 length:807 start_codon:yes stop_codon:yes gene_type:complete
MKVMNKIVADDLGMSPGTNIAIKELVDIGALTHVSIFSTGDYYDEGMKLIAQNNINKGLHFNLTYGKSAIGVNELTNNEGKFKFGFLGVLLKSFKPSVKKIIEKELIAQIKILEGRVNQISHIDGHRHIHIIPGISNIVKKISKRYNIKEIRVINENILDSILIGKKLNLEIIAGFIKFFVLNTFSYFSSIKSKYNFFSIIYTGQINIKMLNRISFRNKKFEIMTHPSKPEFDINIKFYDNNEKIYRLSKKRLMEYEACLNFQNAKTN